AMVFHGVTLRMSARRCSLSPTGIGRRLLVLPKASVERYTVHGSKCVAHTCPSMRRWTVHWRRKMPPLYWQTFQTMLAGAHRAIPLLFCGVLLNAELKTSPLVFTGTRSPCGCAGKREKAPLSR